MTSLYAFLVIGAWVFLVTRLPKPPSTRDVLAMLVLSGLVVFIIVKLIGRLERQRRVELANLRAVDAAGPFSSRALLQKAGTRYHMAIFNGQPYILSVDGRTITCATCQLTSHNLNDVVARYCGHCCVFHVQPDADAERTSRSSIHT